ncbi:hypothetical protein SDC9_187348 [bioreactor metagenome]|uniref:Uncharacterized protein n=1 Tax=bioreactor metagenome TaxID=1076179 RepID=A0A645HUI1_9ZZZZ
MATSDVGDGDIIKELHRTIQFSDRVCQGANPGVVKNNLERDSEGT